MTTSYSSLLGLALPVQGELSGAWGDVVNNYITQYLDAAIAGAQTISGSQTAVTLSTANGTSLSQAGTGTTGSAQYQIINCTGNPASLLTVTVPASSRKYLVLNSTSTSQSVKIVGSGPTTGVTLVSGEKALIAWNGSDFVKVASTAAAGSTTQVQYNSGGLLAGSSNFVFDGANVGIGTTSPVSKLHLSGDFQQQNANYIKGKTVGGTSTRILGVNASDVLYLGAIDTALSGGLLYVNNGSTQMAIDASGNLGLGASASSWKTGFKALETSYGSFSTADNATTQLALNSYYSSTGWVNRNTGNSLLFQLVNGGGFAWQIAPSAAAGATPAFTTAMTLDASGNLGLGVSPSSWITPALQMSRGSLVSMGGGPADNITLAANAYATGSSDPQFATWKYVATGSASLYEAGRGGQHFWKTAASGTAGSTISWSAAMTLDSSGRLMVGTASVLTGSPTLSVKATAQYAATLQQSSNADYVGLRIENVYAQSAQNATMVQLVNSGGAEVGSIKSTGSATSFNTSSDRRLKSNITAAGDSSIVDDIEVVQYDWLNGDGHVSFGVVAQDLHGVFPDAVSTGDSGADVSSPWGVDYSKLVPLLLKEIQQLRSRVAILESK